MKKIIFIIVTICLLSSSTVLAASFQESAFVPANIKVFVNGQPIRLAEEPLVVNKTIMLPLRAIAESLGATVEWKQNPNRIIIKKDKKELNISLNYSKEVMVPYCRQLFIMERIPFLINGRTMVSLRFISEALGTNLSWDEEHTTVNITNNGNFAELPQANNSASDKYYKLHDILIGGSAYGPDKDKAKDYVLKEDLLNEVKDVEKVYTRFSEFGDSVTMVVGIDRNGQERFIWLSQDPYIGEISVRGSVLKNAGLSQEKVISLLKDQGINEASIKNISIGPFENDQIVWFVIADQENKHYYCWVDFYTGAVNISVN